MIVSFEKRVYNRIRASVQHGDQTLGLRLYSPYRGGGFEADDVMTMITHPRSLGPWFPTDFETDKRTPLYGVIHRAQ